MKSLPLPIRVAAGLAVTAVEQARTLPAKLAGLPVTVASQALQVSMRVQQQVTELAIRGDEVLSGLRPVEETPEWATFDEDIEDDDARYDFSRPSPFDRVDDEPDQRNGHHAADPWVQEERALAEETEAREKSAEVGMGIEAHEGLAEEAEAQEGWARAESRVGVREIGAEDAESREGLPEAITYDELSLPQLRARLRQFSEAELTELLDYERANSNRPAFTGMLTRRIATVRDQQ